MEIFGFLGGSLSSLGASFYMEISGALMLGDILCKGRVTEGRILRTEFLLDPTLVF